MVHIRLDDNRIELRSGEPRVGTDDEAQLRLDAGQEKGTLAITMAERQLRFFDYRSAGSTGVMVSGTAAAPVDWDCPTIGGNRAVVSTEAPMLATLEVGTDSVSGETAHRLRASLAHIGQGTSVRFRGVKVIFRSEPEIVDAQGATDLLVKQDC
jgi:hypothetical protein